MREASKGKRNMNGTVKMQPKAIALGRRVVFTLTDETVPWKRASIAYGQERKCFYAVGFRESLLSQSV